MTPRGRQRYRSICTVPPCCPTACTNPGSLVSSQPRGSRSSSPGSGGCGSSRPFRGARSNKGSACPTQAAGICRRKCLLYTVEAFAEDRDKFPPGTEGGRHECLVSDATVLRERL